MIRTVFVFASLLGSLLLQSAPAQVTVHTSGQYSSGDYIFAEDTEFFGWTNGVSIHSGRLQLDVSIPFLVQSDPWVTYTAAGITPSGGPQYGRVVHDRRGHQRGRREPIALPDTVSGRTTGLGDPQVSLGFDLVAPTQNRVGIQLTAAVKPPVADVDAGFGSGAWDGGIGVSLSRSFMPWFVFAEGTYWWLGDLDDLPLKNGVAYSVALGQTLYEGRWGILASVAGSTRVIEGVDPPLSISGSLSYSPGRWSVNATAGSGLTEGAANWTFGIGSSFTMGE